ncbi:MAG: DUF488 family protein [Rhodothermales bacterium]
MKTASYFTYFGPGRVGISRGNPRGLSGYRIYRALAPWRYMLDLSEAEYRDIYFDEILAHLDPAKVVADLEALAGDHEPVLLCFERPPFTPTNWCHRRMVAEWLADKLGLEVPELERGGAAAPPTPGGNPTLI